MTAISSLGSTGFGMCSLETGSQSTGPVGHPGVGGQGRRRGQATFLRRQRAHLAEQVVAAFVRHFDVAQEHVRPQFAHRRERLRRGRDDRDLGIAAGEDECRASLRASASSSTATTRTPASSAQRSIGCADRDLRVQSGPSALVQDEDRQMNGKGRARPGTVAKSVNRAAMQLDQMPRDREPEPEPGMRAGAARRPG